MKGAVAGFTRPAVLALSARGRDDDRKFEQKTLSREKRVSKEQRQG
jgi:hypothetical protein